MDLGTGIALSTLCLSCGAVVLKWVPLKRPPHSPAGGSPEQENTSEKCTLHPGIMLRLADGDRDLKALKAESAATRAESTATRKIVIRMAAHMKIPISDIEDELKELV